MSLFLYSPFNTVPPYSLQTASQTGEPLTQARKVQIKHMMDDVCRNDFNLIQRNSWYTSPPSYQATALARQVHVPAIHQKSSQTYLYVFSSSSSPTLFLTLI